MKAILIDHDDSFTFNLQHWIKPACTSVEVVNHRDLTKNTWGHLVILSPGPKTPQDYPHVLEYVNNLSSRTAVFGVCLGLQMLVHASGGKVKPYTPPLHGKKSKLDIKVASYGQLKDAAVARYHSLYCAEYSSEKFETIAFSQDDKIPMWLRHREKRWMGVQFHPESFLTEKPEIHLKYLSDWLIS